MIRYRALKDFCRWFVLRDSESAACLAIWLAHDMTQKDARKIGEYYDSVATSMLVNRIRPDRGA